MFEDLPQSIRSVVEAALKLQELKLVGKHEQIEAELADREDELASAVEALTNKSRSFVGKAGGDGECFCWKVDGATYERLTGMSPSSVWWSPEEGCYVYPHSVMGLDIIKDTPKQFTVIVEDPEVIE